MLQIMAWSVSLVFSCFFFLLVQRFSIQVEDLHCLVRGKMLLAVDEQVTLCIGQLVIKEPDFKVEN
jgi:hypothetical protein